MEGRPQPADPDSLFADWLARFGTEEEFELLCREQGELAPALRGLHAEWRRVCALLRRAGLGIATGQGRSFALRLKEQHGSGVDPAIALERGEEREDAPASSQLLKRLAAHALKGSRYQLRGELARGGMGAILKVWDEDLRRSLAMKVILGKDEAPSGMTPPVDKRMLARFLEEAQVTGQLDHPGIVPVHELGLDGEGRVYFTMKLVKGRDLKTIFGLVFEEQDGWNETRALGVILKVCEALAYAHAKGVVHRDLKPANIMVGNFGEVYVMDWGLARVLGRDDMHDLRLRTENASSASVRTERRDERFDSPDSPLVTMDGDVVGTPAYMSPEQARGDVGELGPRSDVYAIGAVLYHLLSREMPYVSAGARVTNRTILAMVLHGPPRALPTLRSNLPPELVAICQKAMARDPASRYRDMTEVAADLRAFLEGRVVRAHKTGALAELRLWIRRNQRFALTLAAALLGITFTVAMYGTALATKNHELADARNTAVANERAAVAVREALAGILDGVAHNAQEASIERLVQAVDSVETEFIGDRLSKADLLGKAGRIVHMIGYSSLGERWLERALTNYQDELGPSSSAALDVMSTLESVYQETEDWESLLSLQEQVTELLAQTGDPELDAAKLRLAATLRRLGRDYGRARQLDSEVIVKLSVGKRENDALFLRALRGLAETQVLVGDLDAARETLHRCISGWEKSASATADSRTERELARIALAAVHASLGQHEQAAAIEQQALSVLQEDLPPTDERLFDARRQYVSSLSEIGDLVGAYAQQQYVVRACLRGTIPGAQLDEEVDRLARLRADAGAPSHVDIREVVGGEEHLGRALLGRSLSSGEFATQLSRADGAGFDMGVGSNKSRVIVILRGFEREACLYCIAQIEALLDASERFRELGAELVVVYPAAQQRFGVFRESYALINSLMGEPPADVVTTVFDADLVFSHSLGRPEYAPMTLILDRALTIRFAYVGVNINDRPSCARVLDELVLLNQEQSIRDR